MGIPIEAIEVSIPSRQWTIELPTGLTDIIFSVEWKDMGLDLWVLLCRGPESFQCADGLFCCLPGYTMKETRLVEVRSE